MQRLFFCLYLLFLLAASSALATVPTYTGFTNRNQGYVIQNTDWNNEFGNFIAYVNTNITGPLNLVSVQKAGILTANGSVLGVLGNNGITDDGKVLTLQNSAGNGLVWAAPVTTTVLTTKGDLLAYSSNLVRHPVGTDGTVLTADSTQPDGINWKQGGVPSGSILLWSGSIATIPTGFVLCDGNNSTPNLQGLFVVGAGNTSPAATSGMGNLNPGGPSGDASSGVGLGPVHQHFFSWSGNTGYAFGSNLFSAAAGASVTTPSHAHSYSGSAYTANSSVTPRYYALCYIMKT